MKSHIIIITLFFVLSLAVNSGCSTSMTKLMDQAQNGDIAAANKLADKYCELAENATEENEAKVFFKNAAQYYKISADQNNSTGCLMLGILYFFGMGVECDKPLAMEYYAKAAEQQIPQAQYLLAVGYYQGDGVPKNPEQAMLWMQKAAEKDVKEAVYFLGLFYLEGIGVAPDSAKALAYFEQAAELGIAAADYQLGEFYSNGKYHKADYTKSFEHFSRSAYYAYVPAQTALANAYLKGQGVLPNRQQAIFWYEAAAAMGDATAIEALEKLEQEK